MFLLPDDTVGLTVKETWDALGMRANCANTVSLDCKVARGTASGALAPACRCSHTRCRRWSSA